MTYSRFALEALVDRTLEALVGKPMVFLLGAGASAAAPSCLPQAKLIQRVVYDCVAPADTEAKQRELIIESLPEIYHEVLLEIGGPDTRDIWRVLSFWESPSEAPSLANFGLRPNLVHLLVVYMSWRAKRPIMTVNFDQMLERAADELGLMADTGLYARPGPDSVAIWKLHGSVADPLSIRTTLQGITAVDPAVHERVKHEFNRSTGCLIGYSGQDIDFFPFLCGWASSESVYWLSLDLQESAITRFPRPFLGVDALAEEWAHRVVLRMPANDIFARRLKARLHCRLPAVEEVKSAYEEVVRCHAIRVYGYSFPVGHPKRVLAHAMILAALGRNTDADKWADRFLKKSPSGDLACRAHMLKSALAHEFARYRDSKLHAKIAKRLAREHGLGSQATEALLRIDEANRMLYVPPRLSFVRPRNLMAPRSSAIFALMIFHAISLRYLGRKWGGQIAPGYADLRVRFEYLEHLVRTGALLQGLVERVWPMNPADNLSERYWHWIEQQCYQAGYALGIGNAKKYRLRWQRRGRGHEEVLSVLDLYKLVPSPTGTAIHHRDVAEGITFELRTIPFGSTYEHKLRSIVDRYDKALAAAQEAGDPSLELKIMLGLKRVAPDRNWPPEKVSELLVAIQSPAYAKFANRIVASLAKGP